MSKRLFTARSINIFELQFTEWTYPKHSHNFFELVFIKKGSGSHILNENRFDYKTGDIFLLTPKDEHEFVIAETTIFGFLKFTEQLFLEKTELLSDHRWKRNIDTVVLHSNSLKESIVADDKDRKQLFKLFGIMLDEFKNPVLHSRPLLLELFGAMLILVSRNINTFDIDNNLVTVSEKEKVNDMLAYIRQNLLDKEKTSVRNIAALFFMSPNYVSMFIKKHAGISIQQFTIQTKLKMAERMLKQTHLNISEIAQKMGFSDASHFNKLFKKHMGKNPSDFR